jgi:DNA-binding ferritin-like protein
MDDIEPIETETQQDFQIARSNLHGILMSGQEALNRMVDLADQSQHPRAYEVVATLINALTQANKDLLDLSKKKKDIIGNAPEEKKTVTNNLFVGSTAELQKMLKSMRDE